MKARLPKGYGNGGANNIQQLARQAQKLQDDMGYIYATLKGNTKKKTPTIGFISHMDTSPDASGKDQWLHFL